MLQTEKCIDLLLALFLSFRVRQAATNGGLYKNRMKGISGCIELGKIMAYFINAKCIAGAETHCILAKSPANAEDWRRCWVVFQLQI